MLRSTIAIIIAVLCVCVGCENRSGKPTEAFDLGSVENDVYHNEYFDMDIRIPPGWTVNDKRSKFMSGGKKKNNRLLLISKYDRDSSFPETFNPSFAMMADNLGGSHYKTTTAFLDDLKEQLKKKSAATVSDAYGKTRIGGKEFTVMSGTMEVNDMSVQQEYYVRFEKGYVLVILLGYGYEKQLDELKDIFKTIKFN